MCLCEQRAQLAHVEAAELIRRLHKRGLSQQTIARRTGLTQGAISHLETGRRRKAFETTREALLSLYEEVLLETAREAANTADIESGGG